MCNSYNASFDVSAPLQLKAFQGRSFKYVAMPSETLGTQTDFRKKQTISYTPIFKTKDYLA
jgi:hypothetical protein